MGKLSDEKKVMESVAANKIAKDWLMFADSVIARAERPVSLSKSVHEYAAAAWEKDGLMEKYKYTKASRDRIAGSAINNAKDRLYNGEFQNVRDYFTILGI